jgi:ketosteroid isomerase-like protein
MKIGPESTRALTARAPGPAEDERRSQAQAEVARARREAVAALEKSRRDELARVTEQVAASEKAVTAPAAVGQVQVDPARQPAQQPPIHTGSVQAVLDAWAAGYNSRDVDAVAAVFVLSPEARQRLAEAFAQASSYERTLQDCRILQIATNRASVHCRVHTHVVARAGGAINPVEPLTFTLERRGDGWIITKIALTRVE